MGFPGSSDSKGFTCDAGDPGSIPGLRIYYLINNLMWSCKQRDILEIAGRNINNLRYADYTTLMAEIEKELETLNESKRGE